MGVDDTDGLEPGISGGGAEEAHAAAEEFAGKGVGGREEGASRMQRYPHTEKNQAIPDGMA